MVKTGTNVSFRYDANGLPSQKTVNGMATDYTLHGKLVTGFKQGSDVMHFFCGKNVRPQMVDLSGTLYTYVYNLLGDIVAILDRDETKVVK